MKDIKIYCSWDLNFELKHEKQIELYVDQIPGSPIPPETVRFVFLLEPPEILNLSNAAISGFKNKTFDYLFTHNQELLNYSDKCILFPFGTTWIRDYEFPEKEFSVSALVGGKLLAPGHHLRHKVWFKEDRINIPRRFFLSGNFGGIENYNNNPILGSDKKPLFNSQFHICIENAKRENWFTEKLIDCMVTKTVPIYWGCPNIGKWFDIRGMMIVDNIDDIVSSCNSINENTYNEMLPFVEENYNKAQYLKTIGDRLKEEIEKKL